MRKSLLPWVTELLYRAQKAWNIKEKLDKLDFIKIKNVFLWKDTVKIKTSHSMGVKTWKTHS